MRRNKRSRKKKPSGEEWKKKAGSSWKLVRRSIKKPSVHKFYMFDFTAIDREDFRNLLLEIGGTRMPFGKFGIKEYPPSGVPIMDLPEEYLAWFMERGCPKGRLGELMAQVWEIKSVGMDSVFDPLRRAGGGRFRFRPVRKRTRGFD